MPSPAEKPALPAAAALRALHEARAAAEIAAAEVLCPGADAVAWRGDLLGEIALVKGLPGPAEASGGPAISGADGEALSKALEALGWNPEHAFFTLSRPEPGVDPVACAERLRAQLEAVDPRVIVALDDYAATDVAAAFGIEPLTCGRAALVLGRRLVAIDGFEASLDDEKRKRKLWSQLKAARPDGPVY